ncbi:hypothetical protein OU995_04190 [Roseateles sp. SL47]|uniref:hypothetical protein n=1 Tax=Roseateles sp. SL47 TaxID=2995138 RepID=UPI00226FE215|nr:hypothetical protein [Roseateles sp. SL47]WAC73943.1 hypothetical protein OU995_04190 [Roseateles sp. SL47]
MRPDFPFQPPYYAVIFRSQRTPSLPDDGYGATQGTADPMAAPLEAASHGGQA